jgi:hypothetical protein
MLQMMQNKIEAEGEKQKKMHDQFMCWCTTGAGDLAASIDASGVKIPQVESALTAAEESLTQTKADLKGAQVGRDAAKAQWPQPLRSATRRQEHTMLITPRQRRTSRH